MDGRHLENSWCSWPKVLYLISDGLGEESSSDVGLVDDLKEGQFKYKLKAIFYKELGFKST